MPPTPKPLPRRRMVRAAIAICSLLAAAGPAAGADWPQWRGPNFNGSSPETRLPDAFGLTENLKWTYATPGKGAGTPVIVGKRVFLPSVDKATGGLLAVCVDADSGTERWRRPCGRNRRYPRNSMASPSPATNGAVVCFTFGTGCIHTFDMEGKEAWNLDLVKAYGPNTLLFGYSSSPLLYKDRLIIQMLRNKKPDQYPNRVPEGADSRPVKPYLLALDLDSGRVLWQQPRPNDAVKESQEAYTTPVPFSGGGAPGFLVLGGDCLTAHDVRTGEEWWRWCGYNPDRIGHWRVVPTPVVHGGKAFVAAPKHNPLYAIALAPERHAQPRERTCVEWTFPTFTPDASSPLIYRDRIYLLQDDTSRLHCLDPDSGNAIWSGNVGLKAVIRASLTGADGKIYAVSEKGEVVVLAAGDAFSVLHRTQIDGAPVQSSIVAANGCLYLRTARELLCFSLPPE